MLLLIVRDADEASTEMSLKSQSATNNHQVTSVFLGLLYAQHCQRSLCFAGKCSN